MNIIIDPNLKKRLESIRLHPARMFVCLPCVRVTDRNGVTKDAQGKYHCLICGNSVTVYEVKK